MKRKIIKAVVANLKEFDQYDLDAKKLIKNALNEVYPIYVQCELTFDEMVAVTTQSFSKAIHDEIVFNVNQN